MGGLKVNFAEVEGGFETLPEDVYECIIDAATMRKGEGKDHPYINLELKVLDDDFEDRRIWKGLSLSPKALGFAKDALVILGVIEEDDELEFEWDDDLDIGPSEGPALTVPDLDGMACSIRTVNSVRDGKERQDAWGSEFVESDGASSKPATKKASGNSKGSGSGSRSKAKSGTRSRKLR